MYKLPPMCKECKKKHVIKGNGETCLKFFQPPKAYVQAEECPTKEVGKEGDIIAETSKTTS